ncbi:S-layer homology domain-containing protein [Heliorestis acidaminivorans]|nr:S-layer homology domain-containing protein [Heliorestis acidaminivorans]
MQKMRTYLSPLLVFAMLFTFLPLAVAEESTTNNTAAATEQWEALLQEHVDAEGLLNELLTSPELIQLAGRAALGADFSLQLQAELIQDEVSYGTATLMVAENQQDLLALMAGYAQLQNGADVVDVIANLDVEDLFARLQVEGQDVDALTLEELEKLYEDFVVPFDVENALATSAYQVHLTLMDVTNTDSPQTVLAKILHFGEEAVEEVVVPTGLTDIEGHWANAYILDAVEKGLIFGYEDKTFKPDQEITRVEFFVLAARAFALTTEEVNLPFVDADLVYEDYKGAVSAAVATGILEGYENADGTFSLMPEQKITRDEMAAFVVKALELELVETELAFADAGDVATWAVPYIATATENGLVKGQEENRYVPQGVTTRAQAAVLFLNVLDYLNQE